MKRFASLFSMVNLSENLQNRLRALSSFRKTSPTYKSQVQMNFSHTPMRKTMFIIILRYVHQETNFAWNQIWSVTTPAHFKTEFNSSQKSRVTQQNTMVHPVHDAANYCCHTNLKAVFCVYYSLSVGHTTLPL